VERRRLGLFDVVCIGINGIVGTGIFRLPGRLAEHLGAASWLAFAVVGVLLSFVALCFAEVAGMFRVNGGPHAYARAAFGERIGFGVGWICWVTMILGWSAVASGMPAYLGQFVPSLGEGPAAGAFVALLVGALAAINYAGIKPGAWTTNVFTVAKLAPLLLFVIVGAWFVRPDLAVVDRPVSAAGFAPAVMLALFTLGGFENTPVPAGEAKRPERHMPIAVVAALFGATGLYVAVQIVAIGTLPSLAGSTRPLADAAGAFWGPSGAALMAIGALVSMTGFVAGSALLTPRYLQVLAADGFLPGVFGRIHSRFGTPHVAIVVSAAFVVACTQVLDFDRLVDLSAVAALVQYVATCAALLALRRRRPEAARTWRLRGGPVIPVLGLLVSLLIATQAQARDWLFAAAALGVGVVLAAAWRSRAAMRAGAPRPE
jgi:amino acid transporter